MKYWYMVAAFCFIILSLMTFKVNSGSPGDEEYIPPELYSRYGIFYAHNDMSIEEDTFYLKIRVPTDIDGFELVAQTIDLVDEGVTNFSAQLLCSNVIKTKYTFCEFNISQKYIEYLSLNLHYTNKVGSSKQFYILGEDLNDKASMLKK